MTLTVTALSQLREKAGTDLGTTGWLDITQDRVDTFADATGDHQWIHIDPERAARGPFGGPIAHGYLTLSLISLLFSDLLRRQGLGMSINYGLNRVRFPAPVPVGSRIRLTGRIAEVEDVPGGLQLTYDFTVEVEGSAKPACVAQAIHRYHA
ncbi:MaoC family dehydratase [Peterkaempfera bronchialis]|uniref:MaoC family dehydratase n=1 Tax=Peterkaempfera bronchialis TaxID=2126346 RepID=UPI003C2DCF24